VKVASKERSQLARLRCV